MTDPLDSYVFLTYAKHTGVISNSTRDSKWGSTVVLNHFNSKE